MFGASGGVGVPYHAPPLAPQNYGRNVGLFIPGFGYFLRLHDRRALGDVSPLACSRVHSIDAVEIFEASLTG